MHKERNRPHDPNGIPTRNRPKARRRSHKAEQPPGTALIPLKPARKRAGRGKADRGKAVSAPAPVILMPPPAMPLLLPSPVGIAKAPAFPAGLVAPPSLGVAIRSVAMPDIPLRAASATPVRRKPRAEPKLPQPVDPPAITLPTQAEPLVTAAAPASFTRTHFATPETALPRARALAKPSNGLVGAIGAWLSSFGKLIAAGFMVKKVRKRATSTAAPVQRRPITPMEPRAEDQVAMREQATMRERTEMLQLRAENRRLRAQLEALEAMRGKPSIPRWSERQKENVD